MKKTSKLLILVTMGIVITLVIVSAGCLSMSSAPSSSSTTTTTPQVTPATTYTPDLSKIDTSKIVTPVVEKKDTMIGKWKMAASFNDYSLVITIKDETSAEYDMTVKSAKGFNSDNEEDDMEYETGDIIHSDCKLVKKSDGSYSIVGTEGGVIRNGDKLLWGDLDGYNLGSLKYDAEKDKLTYSSEGESVAMTRTT